MRHVLLLSLLLLAGCSLYYKAGEFKADFGCVNVKAAGASVDCPERK